MSITRAVVATAVAAVAALCASPALAVGPPADPGAGHRHDTPSTSTTSGQTDTGGTDDAATPGPDASAKTKAKAYGRYCQGQSKRHVPHGEKGTPFSRCVTAMAKVATGSTDSPRRACSGLSKRHVHGEKGTAFSRCVRAAARLKHAQDDGSTEDDQSAANDDAKQTA
jgi:hypothetical protein